MPKISLSEWANVAEICAAIGVIISLIFVGIELQSGTEATETATRHEIYRKDLAYLSLQIDSSVLAKASSKARNGEELSPLENDQLVRSQLVHFTSMDHSYGEFRRGAQSSEEWLRHRIILQDVIENSRYAKLMWEGWHQTFTPEFQELVNSFLAD